MNFEVKIKGNEVWTMRAAGVEMDAYQELDFKVTTGKAKLPATVTCPYFLSDKPVDVQITVLASNHFRIEVADARIAKVIQKAVKHFDPFSHGPASNRAHKARYARFHKILMPDGYTAEDVEAGDVTLSRRAQEALMKLCEAVHFTERSDVYWQFRDGKIPKEDRVFVARWLLQRFAVEKDPALRDDIDTVFLGHSDLILRELADDAIQLLKTPRLAVSRSGMIYYLAKLKHPQAAELIASVMDEDRLAWMSLRCLGDLKAKQYEARVRKYLRDPDSEIRLEAKRALKKMGCDVGKAPPPVHLVSNRRLLPKDFEEWSANLDFENLEPVMKTLAGFIEKGFGAKEIAEVLGVAEEMRVEQTKALRFPIIASGRKSEVWLVIFMDDINSPDFEIHAAPELIKKFEPKVDLPD